MFPKPVVLLGVFFFLTHSQPGLVPTNCVALTLPLLLAPQPPKLPAAELRCVLEWFFFGGPGALLFFAAFEGSEYNMLHV